MLYFHNYKTRRFTGRDELALQVDMRPVMVNNIVNWCVCGPVAVLSVVLWLVNCEPMLTGNSLTLYRCLLRQTRSGSLTIYKCLKIGLQFS